LQCDNPCNADESHCNVLPTQIDTFSTQFFGDGLGKHLDPSTNQIVWDLPCGLSSGLASNPRLPGESVACYFERLFEAGIPGVPGPEGDPGTAGAPGADAFTTTLQDFTQPDLSAPYITILTKPVEFIVERLYMIIQGSGVYQILDLEDNGTALLQLLTPFVAAGVNIPSGTIMIVSGFPGIRTLGPVGAQGPPGPVGAVGPQGLTGLPGGQGPQGVTTSLFHSVRPLSPKAQWNNLPSNAYSDMSTSGFKWPIAPTSTGTWFLSWYTEVYVADRFNAGAVTGNVKIKIVRHDLTANTDTDIVGTERIVTWEAQPTFVSAGGTLLVPTQDFLISFIDTINSGNYEYRLWAASSINLSNFQVLGVAKKSSFQGFKIQP
jgi:hypothetical protein